MFNLVLVIHIYNVILLKRLIIQESSLNLVLIFVYLLLKTLEITFQSLLLILYAKTQTGTKALSKKGILGLSLILGTHSVPPFVELECTLTYILPSKTMRVMVKYLAETWCFFIIKKS